MKIRRILLLLIAVLFFFTSQAQVVQTVISNIAGTSYQALLHRPDDYASTTTKYPLLVFLHGSGEGTPPLSRIYNNSSAGGPAYFIEHAGWPTSFTNPVDGQAYKFLVVSPQAAGTGWSTSGGQLNSIIQYMVSNYRVDIDRIYITGLSAGGDGIVRFAAHLADDNGVITNPVYKAAAMVPMSEANGDPNQTMANRIVADSVRVWGFGSSSDVHGVNTQSLVNLVNNAKPGFGRYTPYSGGHCCWGTYYNPNYRETINGKSMNIYEWMLQFSRSATPAAPVANAGNNQTITLPTSSVTLDGGSSTGTISSYAWTRVSGPNTPVITTATTATTTVTGLIAGTYVFQLSVNGGASTDQVSITVNPAPVVAVANAGSDQTITLPTSSISLTAAGSTGTISSYAWTRVSGPNTPVITTAAAATTTVTGLVAGTYVFQLSLNGGVSTDQVSIIVNPAPVAAVANAGSDQTITLPISSVSLTAAGSTGTISSYAWTRVSGPSIPVITMPAAATTTVTSLVEGTYVFQLSVNGGASTDQVSITVNAIPVIPPPPPPPPVAVANAGSDQTVTLPTSSVSLTAAGSTGTIISYSWTRVSGPNVPVITTAAAAATTVTGLVAGTYVFQLSVNGGASTDQVSIVVNPAPVAPVANAGSTQTITLPLSTVSLTAAGSTGTISSYTWTRVSGPNTPAITSPATAVTTVTGLVAGTYIFQLSLNGGASTAQVTINVNAAPTAVANAGLDQTITLPTSSVVLNGAGSTGTITSYAWSRVSGPNTPTFGSSASVSTAVGATGTALVAGTYVFRLTLNGGSTDDVSVTVNAAASAGPCSRNKYYVSPHPYDSTLYINPTSTPYPSSKWLPGDTMVFKSSDAYGFVEIRNLNGTSECPITIINEGGQVVSRRTAANTCGWKFYNSKYIHMTGTGHPGTTYGFKAEYLPNKIIRGVGVSFEQRSKNFEFDHIDVHNVSIGIFGHTEGGCVDSLNYPNWIMDTLIIHDMRIIGTYGEGMYIGSTSPDNSATSYDPRPVVCNGVTTYPRPMRNGYTKIYNNILDSTGRGGIQLASASKDISEIFNNVVKHAGMAGNDAQGTGISIGAYTRAYIHDNTVVNTLTWGIASLGGSGTNIPLRIENNYIDSSGFLYTYNNINETLPEITPTTPVFAPGSLPGIDLYYVNSLFVKTAPTQDVDSTRFWIKGNRMGIQKHKNESIQVQDGYGTIHKIGNLICGNTRLDGITPVNIWVDPIVKYTANCSNPTAFAGGNKTISLPTSTVTLSGTGTAGTGHTLSSYTWTKISGPGPSTIATPGAASTNITGLVQGVYVFRLTVTQDDGQIASSDATVTVNPAAVPAVADAGSDQTITLPVNQVVLNGSASTGTVTSYSWIKISGPASFTISSPGAASTTVTGLIAGVYVFQLSVNGGSTDIVQVTVNPALPVADAGSNQSITLPTSQVTLDGSASTGTISSYAWTLVSGPAGYSITNASSSITTVTGLVQGVYVFRLTLNGGSTSTVQVTVNSPTAPVADAGIDQVITLPISQVTLDAGASTGVITSYTWTKISGPSTFNITSPASVTTTVTGLVEGVYLFQLTLNGGNSAIVKVTVNAPLPVADAGSNQIITLPVNQVTLDGSGSTGAISSYSWTKISGPATYIITSPTSSTTNVNGLVAGVYVFQLALNGGSTATVQVTVNPALPVANAGYDQVITLPTNQVMLDGTASSGATSYSWSKISGPGSFSLSSPGASSTAVTGLTAGVYVFQLTVNGGSTATVQVTVNSAPAPGNQLPVANAGSNQSVVLPTTVTLNGTASYDPDGVIVQYNWIQILGPGGAVFNDPNAARPVVSGLQAGVYVFYLTVTDNQGATSSSQVEITVGSVAPPPVNQPPVARAGADKTVALPANVTLDGSASYDPDGAIVQYEWTRISGAAGTTTLNSSTSQPTILGLVAGEYVFRLTVTDNQNATATADIKITVTNGAIVVPVANAGKDTSIIQGGIATLNGLGSYSTASLIVKYEWRLVSGPATTSVLSNSNSAVATISNLAPGEYIFELKVTDDKGQVAYDQVKVSMVNTLRADNKLTLYPNPVKDMMNIHIVSELNGPMTIRVYDVPGRIVFVRNNIQKNQMGIDLSYSISHLPAGFFALEILIDGKPAFIEKFVKQQ